MNPINLVHLKFFCDAVLHHSITEAAKINFVTQSTVSQGIRKLETVLGVELLTHARQKLSVTDEGRILFEHAPRVFGAIQNIHDHLNNAKSEVSGTLRFLSTNSLGVSFLAPLYKHMQMQYPAVTLDFQLGGLNFIRTALRKKDADFAIVVYDESFAQFNKLTLKTGRFNLYQHMDAPLQQLQNGVLVDSSSGMHLDRLQEHCERQLGGALPMLAELAGWEVVARFTASNIGVGFFPDYLTCHSRFPELKVHPFEIPALEYEICAIFNKGEKPSKAAQAFFDLFSNCFREDEI